MKRLVEKVLVDLFVPSIGEHYDVFIPDFLLIGSIRILLGKAVQEMSDNRYSISGEEILCDCCTLQIFGDEKRLKDYSVQNGAKLMFC